MDPIKDTRQHPWYHTLVRSLEAPQQSPLGDPLPKFPTREMQENTTGLSSEAAIEQAFAFYRDVDDECARLGRPLSPSTRLLDFGFGWGRITRVFMEKVALANIRGIDVDPDFTRMTRELFASDNFSTCPAFPPTEFADASFDVVVSYSVFSHLSEEACARWMNEFARIVAPGGIVAVTTRHDTFFDFCAWARSQGDAASGYIRALGELFPDIAAARARYRAGQIVHASSEGVGGGGPRDSSFYGETWIPREYAATAYAPAFRLAAMRFDEARYNQACLVFVREPAGAA